MSKRAAVNVERAARAEKAVEVAVSPSQHALVYWVVRIAALWVLAGAFAKAFAGTPKELPAPILALEIDPFLVISAAVVVETTIAFFALFVPRIGWPPLAALLATFAVILVLHLRTGAATCGCFGGALPMPAWIVFAIDISLLVAVLIVVAQRRPWRVNRLAGIAAPLGFALGLALGWYSDARMRPLRPVEARSVVSRSVVAPPSPTRVPEVASVPERASAPWQLPDLIPDQVILRPISWVGRRLVDTELGRWTDVSAFPPDATLIIYYASCNHCADHLRELAEKQKADPASAPKYVLIQLPTPTAYTGRLFVNEVPNPALHVDMPAIIKAWVITPPWDVFIENGVVKRAERVKWSGEADATPAK
ncbi:MAG: hypothetical protein SGJ09_00310 [Phycisphaerae bacterium]|nr:hypothetical protein [Phycisphaerae bacterium]